MAQVVFDKIDKSYGDVKVIEGLDLDIRDEEFMVLVGPSGCGKSTLLRMLAGLEEVTGGEIRIDERLVNEVQPKDRDIAMVFQSYALYPHMSVRENLEFGLRIRKTAKAEMDSLVNEAADILDIRHLLDRKPRQLSGGQRQRVAVGRAIVRKPSVFLFDEPLSNLDAKLRVQMRAEITKLQQRLKVTTVYVTHDQIEAMTMGHRIAIMNGGVLQQVGTPLEVYDQPANLFVATFIGTPPMNLLQGRFDDAGAVVRFSGFELPVPENLKPFTGSRGGQAVTAGIRPENVREAGHLGDVPTAPFTAQVELVEPLGHEVVVYARSGDDLITAKTAPSHVPSMGDHMQFDVNLTKVQLFDSETERRLDA
jgi:multiple sugar transport system ATP-binding protein